MNHLVLADTVRSGPFVFVEQRFSTRHAFASQGTGYV